LRIFEIFKKASRGLSAADLDHYSRGQTRSQLGVLVPELHQNRSTLKGRSAGQRHKDRHTDRQTRVKIMALQVCNRAKKKETTKQKYNVRICYAGRP